MTLPSGYEIQDIFTHCKNFLGGIWLNAKVEDFTVNPIIGGLSNYLMVAELNNTKQENNDDILKVLVRIHGQLKISDPQLILVDTVIYTYLSERNYLPKLYGIFKEGRLEEYIEPSRVLTLNEIRQPMFYKDIACQLYHIHQLELPVVKRPDPFFLVMLKMLKEITDSLNAYETNDQDTISTLKKSYRNRAIEMLHYVRDNSIREKVNQFQKLLFEDLQQDLCVVFSHNDLHAGNVLCVTDNKCDSHLPNKMRLQIIDYEWSSYNIRGYDFAFFFTECAFDYDVQEWPCFRYEEEKLFTEQEKMDFLTAYFSHSSTPNILDDPEQLLKIQLEIKLGLALEMIINAVWCFDQCLFSDMQMGFLEQGIIRFEIFLKKMEELENLGNN